MSEAQSRWTKLDALNAVHRVHDAHYAETGVRGSLVALGRYLLDLEHENRRLREAVANFVAHEVMNYPGHKQCVVGCGCVVCDAAALLRKLEGRPS